jgi:integrase
MEGLADATIWGALEIIRRIINYGFKTGICDPLGFRISMPRRDNEVVEYLDSEQLNRLNEILDTWPAQDVARMLQVAMLTGMRRGEIFKLRDEEIDFTQRIITLRHPKGGRTVSIPLSKPVAEIFADQKKWRDQRYPESQFIFPGANGKMRVECKSVDRIKKMANLPDKFRIFHGLRHHFAVTLASSREYTLDMIGQLLTHKSPEMTRRYAKFLPDTFRQASERAAELIQSKPSENGHDVVRSETQ